MATKNIAPVTLPNWQGVSDSISLFIYIHTAFASAGGSLYPATVEHNLPYNGICTSGTFYIAAPCTVSGSSLTIPAISLDSTTDSPDNPNALLSAVLWDTAAGQPIEHLGTFTRFSLPAEPTSTTWAQIFATEANF
jgi:hypothetical protein